MIYIRKEIMLLLVFLVMLIGACESQSHKYVEAPFIALDTLSTNDWWNRKTTKIIDMKVDRDQVVAFGIYTTSNNTLKLSAQLFPLYPEESRTVRLELYKNNQWEEVQSQEVNEIGWSVLFRVEDWDMNQSIKYRLLHGKNARFEGTIRRDPIDQNQISMAALSCNSNHDRGDREEFVKNINALDPDFVFFAGDQSYDHKEHTAAWLKFGLQ